MDNEDRLDRENMKHDPAANPDPITGAPGSHPVGTAIGAAGAGAAIGVIAGPIGAVIGAIIGSIGGGLAGHGVAEKIDPTEEDAYWRANYGSRSYHDQNLTYEDYEPAYRYGWESGMYTHDREFNDIEPHLQKNWDTYRGEHSHMEWEKAKHATRDAWDRVKAKFAHHEDAKHNDELRHDEDLRREHDVYGVDPTVDTDRRDDEVL